jgi:uncharacterized membrane protein
MLEARKSASLKVAVSATCAALYAVGSYLTAFTASPWGSGQFRPAAVIPAVFSTLFGPLVGGVGAALGTLIADSAKHGQIYVRSLVASVPGNFVGFYLFGWIMKRRFSWENFVKASQVTLVVGNAIVAFVYVYFRTFVEASYPVAFREAWIHVSLGLVAWWYVTMLPFVLLLGPPLIRAVASAFPGVVYEEARLSTLRSELPKRSFAMAMLVPGIIMLLIGAWITLTDPNQLQALKLAYGAAYSVILAGMQALFLGSGAVLLVLGVLVLATGKFVERAK